jgi:hypothetical protein
MWNCTHHAHVIEYLAIEPPVGSLLQEVSLGLTPLLIVEAVLVVPSTLVAHTGIPPQTSLSAHKKEIIRVG